MSIILRETAYLIIFSLWIILFWQMSDQPWSWSATSLYGHFSKCFYFTGNSKISLQTKSHKRHEPCNMQGHDVWCTSLVIINTSPDIGMLQRMYISLCTYYNSWVHNHETLDMVPSLTLSFTGSRFKWMSLYILWILLYEEVQVNVFIYIYYVYYIAFNPLRIVA